jgi:hypothetical protein
MILVILVGINFISAVGEISYCCEKTNDSAWCQNAPQSKCDTSFQSAPTSCEATSYCKLGCCYDSKEGPCMEKTPQKVCEVNGGVWDENSDCEIAQCTLGCCLIGDSASFVTQTRCKRLSSLYGLETNFRTDIKDELQCISTANPQTKGACVFEKEFEKTCKLTTRKECQDMEASAGNSSVKFFDGYLCSADSLGTNCGPTKKTTCVESKDEVYFVDSCGNLANIYDSSKVNDKNYWTKIYDKSESCGYGSSNANSQSCGSCDYLLGSTCKAVGTGDKKPSVGNNICKDLSCTYKGQTYQHGEAWCEESGTTSTDNLPGSRYFRLLCYNNEVTIEPCAEYRAEVCVQSDINGFSTASCIVNKWQDCYSQTGKDDCENADKRDCSWISNINLKSGQSGICVPKYSPGFNFWQDSGGDAASICSTASKTCVVKYEKKLTGSEKCVENCECLDSSWKTKLQQTCSALGDCGSKVNYIGVQGFNNNTNG